MTQQIDHLMASGVADLVGGRLVGPDVAIAGVCTLASPRAGSLGFATSQARLGGSDPTTAGAVLLVPLDMEGQLAGSHILVKHPRLAFAQVMARHFARERASGVASSARIHPTAVLGQNAVVGEFCVIGPGARIGARTELRHHVVIGPGVQIGMDCLIKSGSVIGEEGFGFVLDGSGEHLRMEHIGSAVIGDHVELGALNTVVAGAIDPTRVGDHVKTDDHVHIAHNCIVGRGCTLAACAELSGSVTLGENVWVGPNCSILDGITVGDGAFLGIAAVVTKDLEGGYVYAGSPARALKPRAGYEIEPAGES
jgi:UDP-3-O-[3-hydroxymyristoyl] glucosamine N-acyltransferase LpxD